MKMNAYWDDAFMESKVEIVNILTPKVMHGNYSKLLCINMDFNERKPKGLSSVSTFQETHHYYNPLLSHQYIYTSFCIALVRMKKCASNL